VRDITLEKTQQTNEADEIQVRLNKKISDISKLQSAMASGENLDAFIERVRSTNHIFNFNLSHVKMLPVETCEPRQKCTGKIPTD